VVTRPMVAMRFGDMQDEWVLNAPALPDAMQPAARALAREVYRWKSKRQRGACQPRPVLGDRALPHASNIGDLITIIYENMASPTCQEVEAYFSNATTADLQQQMQRKFAREQYYQLLAAHGQPDAWTARGKFAKGSDVFKLFESMALRMDNGLQLPLGAQRAVRKLCRRNNAGAARPDVLVLLPYEQNHRRTSRPFRTSLQSVVCLAVTSSLFYSPGKLIERIRETCGDELPGCVLAYTPLALGVNPALFALSMRAEERQLPIVVLCQTDSLEAALMNALMSGMSGENGAGATFDPAMHTLDALRVYRKLTIAACRTFARQICSDGMNGAHIPRRVLHDVLAALDGSAPRPSTGVRKLREALGGQDADREDVRRSAALCGYEESPGHLPTYDDMVEYLQRAENGSYHNSSPEVEADAAAVMPTPYGWAFKQFIATSHSGAGIERVLQRAGTPPHLTSGHMFRARVGLLEAGRGLTTSWFALPSSLTHELARIVIHRSAYHRARSEPRRAAPWWSGDDEDAERVGWENAADTTIHFCATGEDESEAVYSERVRELRRLVLRRAAASVRERAPGLHGDARLRRLQNECKDWLAGANSRLRPLHRAQLLESWQVRRHASALAEFRMERVPLVHLVIKAALNILADREDERGTRWFIGECRNWLQGARDIEQVPHELDLLLCNSEHALDMTSVLMPGPQRQAQIGRRIRVHEPGMSRGEQSRITCENTLWFVTASLEHLSPLMELFYNYTLMLSRDAVRRMNARMGEPAEMDPEAQLAADLAQAIANDASALGQPASVRDKAGRHFQKAAAAAAEAAQREARGERVTTQTVSMRTGQLQRTSDYANIRFMQMTGALFGQKRVRKLMRSTLGYNGDVGEAIRALYKRSEGVKELTFFTLADNAQRASYFERAKMATLFRIMLNSMLDPGRPRLAPEFTMHAMPMLKSGALVGITRSTRKLARPVLDDLVSDLDGCYYLSLAPAEQTAPEDLVYGDPERDRAFSSRARRLAMLCPRAVRLQVRASIDRCAERVRPTWEAHQAQAQAAREATDSRNSRANLVCKN